jgi:heptaprenyl diphosphate synthase
MRHDTRSLALCAVLTALALALSYMEGLFPVPVPLPGFKLGLANIVTLFALYWLGAPAAFIILIARCLLGAMFAGNASALIFSLMGGTLALAAMAALSRASRLSVYGVSIGGAAAHNTGQVLAAMITLGSAAPLAYLPALLAVALFTGALTGFITTLLFRAMRNTNMKPRREGL